MRSPDETAFLELIRNISPAAGISLDGYKEKCLRRRIAVRMRARGVQTYAEYQKVLREDPNEYELLKDAITINVTSFFRNAETWDLVRTVLLPQLCTERRQSVRAWSAGCSSGEEAYTLVMLAAEHVEEQGTPERLHQVSVDATDIDRECLKRARCGCYPRDALTDMPSNLARRYFEDHGGECRVVERVRRRVRVRESDLCTDPPPGHDYDLILCRNVVIYFERTMQERVFAAFAEALAPGGFLVLGKVESIFGRARDRLVLLDPRERIYRLAA